MSKQKLHELYDKIDYLKSELDIALFEAKHQRSDIKVLLLLLIENDIPIPEDLINKYINKARMSKLDIELPFNINDYSTGWWILIKQAFKQIAKYFKLYTFKKY